MSDALLKDLHDDLQQVAGLMRQMVEEQQRITFEVRRLFSAIESKQVRRSGQAPPSPTPLMEKAAAFLRRHLRTGPQPTAALMRLADQQGLKRHHLQAGKKVVEAWAFKRSGVWHWSLKDVPVPVDYAREER